MKSEDMYEDDELEQAADEFLEENNPENKMPTRKPASPMKKAAAAETAAMTEETEFSEELLLLYQSTHDIALRNKIVMHYSSIAKNVAYQMRGIFNDYAQIEDIVNQGILALIDCVERFEPKKQVKFQTFAYTRVRGSVIDFVRKQDWIPRRVRVAAKNINRTHDELCTELMREPTQEEIAAKLNMSVELLNKYYSEISGAVTLSFESSIQGLNYSETVYDEPADNSGAPDSRLYKQELRELLVDSLKGLSEREQQVISLYYYEELKQAEIAQVLQISEQRVSQLIAKALQKIRYKVEDYMKE